MAAQDWQELIDRVKPILLQDGEASQLLKQALCEEKAEHVALALENVDSDHACNLFDHLDHDCAAEVLAKSAPELTKQLIERLSVQDFLNLLSRLPRRQAAIVASRAPREYSQAYLALQRSRTPSGAKETEDRLRYRDGTAGRLMTGQFVRLRPDMTAQDAIAAIRETDPSIDIPDDLYVIEHRAVGNRQVERLVGAISIRDLTMAERHERIRDIMATELVVVSPDDEVIDVARVLSKFEFLAVPVVGAESELLGVVPADDLMQVVVTRLNRLYSKAVSTDAEEMKNLTPMQASKRRVPWLLGTMVIELLAGGVISYFDGVLKEVILLASFMPVISAISGNVGLQAAAITVRGLDTGHVSIKDRWSALRKESATTFLMALVCGLALGIVGAVWSQHLPFGIVIGGALTCSMMTAGVMGTIIPMISKRLGFDPATTAGPFETAFQDVIGFAVFLWLASLLMEWLV
ncbi:magnesium transporter [Microvirga sp. M2]|uniref:magnesium transporter n=1 Tax=Microvirga sp. M2 TaxID=3073270 RepID=UPI0039C07216